MSEGSHDHDHDHDHGAELRETPSRRLATALALTASFMVVEAVAGWLTRSLALLSDAAHMLADAGALVLALLAQRVARRPHTPEWTYGFRRAETLAAFLNGVLLGVSAVGITVEALRRWSAPPEVRGREMLAVAVGGLVVNLASAWVLSRGREGHNVNTRAAMAHVLSDAAGSVAAIAAAGMIVAFGWNRADPAVSLLLSVLILWGAWRLVAEATGVLMEAAPSDVDVAELRRVIAGTPGVAGAHDLHVWTVAEGFPVVTVHVVLDGRRHGTEVADEVARRVTEGFGITHVTVQPEAPREPALVAPERLVARRGKEG